MLYISNIVIRKMVDSTLCDEITQSENGEKGT